MKTTIENTQLNYNRKPARLALLAALMLITFTAAVNPAAAQSPVNPDAAQSPSVNPDAAQIPPLDLKSVPRVEAQAVPVKAGHNGASPNYLPPGYPFASYCTYHVHGWYYLTCYWGVIDNNSTVLESISEYSAAPWDRFIGSASMQIYNIAPFPGGVTALVYVNWGSNLNTRLDVFVAD
jgi:hypothetical protein